MLNFINIYLANIWKEKCTVINFIEQKQNTGQIKHDIYFQCNSGNTYVQIIDKV